MTPKTFREKRREEKGETKRERLSLAVHEGLGRWVLCAARICYNKT